MIISGSEAGTYDTCRRQHWYNYELGLIPITGNFAMDRGSQVHYGFAAGYNHIKQNGWDSLSDAIFLAEHTIMRNMQSDMERADMYKHAIRMVRGYWNFWPEDDFEILVVEEQYEVEIAPNLKMGLRVDMIVRMLSGPHAGMVFLVDHKTTKNLWTDFQVRINAQFPKYVKALRFFGIHVDGVIVNQVRTRTDIKDINKMYARAYHRYPEHVLDLRTNEFIASAEEIRFHRLNGSSEANARRTGNSYTCIEPSACVYGDICRMEAEGKDSKATRELYFTTKSDYSYGEKY